MNTRITLDSFTLLSTIGKGTYGKVVLVKKKNGNAKLYALKILKKKFFPSEKQIDRIMTQKKILAKVNHPFIVKLSYSFQTSQRLFFAMDYCAGGQLYQILCKNPRLSEQKSKFYAAQIVLALEYLHSHNIVYRDLKAQNILIEQDGYIKLADFGLSKIFQDEKYAYDICGTPQYIAPEVLMKKGHRTPVDWWALGILLFQMTTGILPFYAHKNRQEVFTKIKSGEPNYEKINSPQMKDLIQKLLVKDPEARLGSKNGALQIKEHPWFQNFDWEGLLDKKLPAPFIPNIQTEDDVSNFSHQFTECPVNSNGQSSFDGQTLSNFSFNKSQEISNEETKNEPQQHASPSVNNMIGQ